MVFCPPVMLCKRNIQGILVYSLLAGRRVKGISGLGIRKKTDDRIQKTDSRWKEKGGRHRGRKKGAE